MDSQIRAIETAYQQTRELARRAVESGRDRDGHHFTDQRLAAVFLAEYDRLAPAAALLAYLKPIMLRQRPPTGGTPP